MTNRSINDGIIIAVLSLFGLLISINSSLYFICLGYLLFTFINKNKSITENILIFIILIPSIEISGRILSLSPLIPWESGKYLFILSSVIGILFGINFKFQRISFNGIFIFSILLISILHSFYSGSNFKQIVFNGFGLTSSLIGLIFLSSVKISRTQLLGLIRVFILSCIPILSYLIINTGNLSQIEYNLGANFETTGGFGSNQISTLLGFNYGILLFSTLFNFKIFGYKKIEYLLLIIFSSWTLLSFSRGGFLTPIVSIIIVMFFVRDKSSKTKTKTYFVFLSLLFLTIFLSLNSLTKNSLLYRYQGETQGTLSGNREKTLSIITTNRSDIFIADIEIWSNNLLFGVGIGKSPSYRRKEVADASHIEFSRILAEQGILGIMVIVGILNTFASKIKRKKNLSKKLSLFFFCLSIITTFHSAFRTILSPIFFSLSYIIINESSNIFRKRHK